MQMEGTMKKILPTSTDISPPMYEIELTLTGTQTEIEQAWEYLKSIPECEAHWRSGR